MQTTFLDATGAVLFVRDDMESGDWTQEEYTVNATFPYDAEKVIERGQRISFNNPATNTQEVFEVRNVTNVEPEHYQQIIAEHIAVSELNDEHIDTQEITDKTPAQALTTALAGTLWAVGNIADSGVSSCDIARGSVWQAVCTIANNWNVYITPRVTINAAGAITGRYLDIAPAQGTWRGVRLSISKNMTDSSVVYDDSEVYTALYGYGGKVDTPHTSGDDTEQELTFAGVVWTATADHPAKPAGQLYIEDPAATALYGRNGRPRYGYYQNSGIDNAEVLLQKTWESLKQCRVPKINITGTVTDLYRLGYADQPLQLHDTVVVDIEETGEHFEKEIIKLRINLIDATATMPEIGDYIANIVYIDRENGTNASGRGGGGRSPGSETNQYNTYAGLENATDKYGSKIGLVVGTRNGNNYVKAAEIALAINEDGSQAYIGADHVKVDGVTILTTALEDIRTEVHSADSQLYSAISQTASQIRTEVANTTSGIYTAINQTSSYVAIEMGRKSSVFFRYTNPLNDPTVTVHENDVWIESNLINSYADASQFTWSELAEYSWLDYYGANMYAYKNGEWKPIAGDQLANYNFEQTKFTNESVSFIRGDLSGLYSQFYQEKGYMRTYVQDATNTLHSEILQTASEINLSVTNTASELRGEISVQADRVSLVVQGTGSNAKIRPAQIVAAINAQTGTSTVLLSADKVNISGNVNLSDAMSVDGNGYILMKKYTFFNQQALFGDGISMFNGSVGYGMTGATLATTIKNATVSGSTLTLTNYAGSTINFSKATALNASWSGSVLTMKAQQTNGGTTTDVATNTIGLGGSSYGTHTIDLAMSQNGTPSLVSGSNILVPVKIVQQQGGGATTDRATTNLQYSISSLLTTGSYNTGGTKTPGSGYIGFSSVTFTIPNASGFTKNSTSYNTSGSNQVGSVSKAGLTANSYMYWTVGGKKYHIVVNA